MVLSFLCILGLATVYCLRRIGARPPARHYGWQALWRVASVIGIFRIGALWLGASALHNPGWPQRYGYLLLMLDLPDIYLARRLRANPLNWAIAGSLLLTVTSFLWAALFLWLKGRIVSLPTSQPDRTSRQSNVS